MKRAFSFMLAAVMLLSLAACGNANQQGQASPSPSQEPENTSTVQPSEAGNDVDNETDGNSGRVCCDR